ASRKLRQILDHRGDTFIGESVVAMAALHVHEEQSARDQLCEVPTRRARVYARDARELARRQRATIQEDSQDGGPARVAKERGHRGDVRFDAQASTHLFSSSPGE